MKFHADVDAFSGLVHTITVTAANVHDITQAAHLIRKDNEFIYGDSTYLEIQKRSEVAGDPHHSGIDYRINRRPSSLPCVSDRAVDCEKHIVYLKSSEILAQAMAIGWTQNVVILEAELSLRERTWYLQAARQFGWSKLELQQKIIATAHLEICRFVNDSRFGNRLPKACATSAKGSFPKGD